MAYNKIDDGIWLGSMMSLQARKSLREAGVTHILSVLDVQAMGTSVENFENLPIFEDFEHLYISVEDVDEEDMLQYFDKALSFMDNAISSGGGVLVHCIAGISRSATFVCAYLMRRNKWGPSEALSFVQKSRPAAHPNEGFMEQLRVFYDCGYITTDESKPYREWRLIQQARELSYQRVRSIGTSYTTVDMPPLSVRWKHIIPSLLQLQAGVGAKTASESGSISTSKTDIRILPADVVQVEVTARDNDVQKYGVTEPIADSVRKSHGDLKIKLVSATGSGVTIDSETVRSVFKAAATRLVSFRCKGCSAKLASGESLVRHQRGPNGPCQHHFIEPVEWMRDELEKGELEGKLMCPKCDKKVGAYLWQGSKCSCGVWVTPSIKLSRAKVDEMVTTTKALL